MTILYLVLGGASGTVARYYMGIWVANATGSRVGGTFAVNIVGSFFIGLFLVLATERFSWPNGLVILVAVGFLGGFTTFSTFSWQTLAQIEGGSIGSAAASVLASVICGLLAVWAGATAARIGA
jgi:CrcB protein